MKKLITESVRIARTKLTNHPQRDCYLHYSFIIQNNKIVEYATNGTWEPPIYFGYHRFEKGSKPKLHAEIWAFKKARGIIDQNKSFQIINIRMNKQGQIKMSKPCKACYNLMTTFGCDRFWYSSEAGFLELR
jgi:hypothetical protein